MRKPLRRSFTFWSGLFVLVFLVWVWVDSFFHLTSMRIPRGSLQPLTVQLRSGVFLFRWEELPEALRYTRYTGVPFSVRKTKLPKPGDPWAADHWWPNPYLRLSSCQYTGPPGLPDEEVMARMGAGERIIFHTHTRQYPAWMMTGGYLLIWIPGMVLWRRWRWHRREGDEALRAAITEEAVGE